MNNESDSIKKLLEKAQVNYDQGNYDDACRAYQEAMNISSDYIRADDYINWGEALENLRCYEEAVKKYQSAIRQAEYLPEKGLIYANAAYAAADLSDRLGKYEDAHKAWVKARDGYKKFCENRKLETPQDTEEALSSLFYILYLVFGELDETAKVGKDLKNIYEKDPLPNIGSEKIDILLKHSFFEITMLDLSLNRKKENIDFYDLDKDIQQHRSQAEKLLKEIHRMLANELPCEQKVKLSLQWSKLYLSLEQYDSAEQKLLQAKKLIEEIQEQACKQSNKRDVERTQESIQALRRLARIYADLGVVKTRQSEFKQGIQYFEEALQLDPDNLMIWSNLAESYLRLNQLERAEIEYQKILRKSPQHIDANVGLGEVYVAMADNTNDDGMYEKAVQNFTVALNVVTSQFKRLPKKELAAIYYARGYANIKLYESSKNSAPLQQAKQDLNHCCGHDLENYKAKRALEKVSQRLREHSRQQNIGGLGQCFILSASIVILVLSQLIFFGGEPKKINDVEYKVLNQSLYFRPVSAGEYTTLTFGAIVLMLVSQYLPQVLKLKVAGIELEKGAVDQIKSTPLGIGK